MREADNVIDLIYALEPLSYYFGVKPSEFWNSSYREIRLFIDTQLIKVVENFKQEIQLQEAVTNKLIGASMVQKRPKVISLESMFKSLFPKKVKIQSAEEQTKILRHIMKIEANE